MCCTHFSAYAVCQRFMNDFEQADDERRFLYLKSVIHIMPEKCHRRHFKSIKRDQRDSVDWENFVNRGCLSWTIEFIRCDADSRAHIQDLKGNNLLCYLSGQFHPSVPPALRSTETIQTLAKHIPANVLHRPNHNGKHIFYEILLDPAFVNEQPLAGLIRSGVYPDPDQYLTMFQCTGIEDVNGEYFSLSPPGIGSDLMIVRQYKLNAVGILLCIKILLYGKFMNTESLEQLIRLLCQKDVRFAMQVFPETLMKHVNFQTRQQWYYIRRDTLKCVRDVVRTRDILPLPDEVSNLICNYL